MNGAVPELDIERLEPRAMEYDRIGANRTFYPGVRLCVASLRQKHKIEKRTRENVCALPRPVDFVQ